MRHEPARPASYEHRESSLPVGIPPVALQKARGSRAEKQFIPEALPWLACAWGVAHSSDADHSRCPPAHAARASALQRYRGDAVVMTGGSNVLDRHPEGSYATAEAHRTHGNSSAVGAIVCRPGEGRRGVRPLFPHGCTARWQERRPQVLCLRLTNGCRFHGEPWRLVGTRGTWPQRVPLRFCSMPSEWIDHTDHTSSVALR